MSSGSASTLSVALLAGGLAERLRPITETLPKSLIPIAGEPFIAHQLRLLRNQGIRHVVICAGYLWQQLQNFVGDGKDFGLTVEYSLDGDKKLGTGGALKKAIPKLGEEFLVMYGDSYLPTSFTPIIDHFHTHHGLALMTLYHNQGQWDASNVRFEQGKILAYEKGVKNEAMTYIDYGLGIFLSEVFDRYPENVALDLADVYKDILKQGRLVGYEVKERFYEIGSQQGIFETNEHLSKRIFT